MNPTKDRLLVRVIPEPKPKKGEQPKGNSIMNAEVLKRGPEVTTAIRIGDHVVFAPYGIDEVIVDGKKLIIVTEELIIAIHDRKKSDTKA